MGNKSITFSGSKSKNIIDAKLEMSRKTGILNLSELGLSPTSSAWSRIDTLSVKLLDISGNRLKNLPVEIYSMINIKKIKISRCDLDKTFSAMSNLMYLTHIDADQNNLEIGMIGTLPTSVVQINFAQNKLSAIPPPLHILIHLTTLDLSSNRIETLEGISYLVALFDLCIDDNMIVELPAEIAKLSQLRKLSVKKNKITLLAHSFEGQSIHKDIFEKSNIDNLNLQGNFLTKQDIMRFDGVDKFLERRRKQKDKNLMTGASTDLEIFGL